MAKRLFLTFLFVFLFYILVGSFPFFPVFAQDFDFNRAFSDYTYNFDLYRDYYREYVLARETYLRYGTLSSKNEALEKTAKMLRVRDEVVRTYLIVLKMKLEITPGISVYERNLLNLELDSDFDWYLSHKKQLSSAGTLEDLFFLADKARERYKNKTEYLIYKILFRVLTGKELALKEKINGRVLEIKEKLGEIKKEGKKNTFLAERWLLETENRLLRFEEKISLAQENMERMEKISQENRGQIYKKSQLTIEESHQYLKEANRYLQEIIREVKITDGES